MLGIGRMGFDTTGQQTHRFAPMVTDGIRATRLSVATILFLLIPAVASAQQAQRENPYPYWGTMVIGPVRDDPRSPLVMAGWTFDALLRNSATVNIILSNRKGTDTALWRGVQPTATVGRRGFELGLGYGRYESIDDWLSFGYEFRAIGGRLWTASHGLEADRWFAGGEATFMWGFVRASGGVVVPTDGSRHTIWTGSLGFSVLFGSTPK